VELGTRISVIGTTGSGKTTVARELASRLGVPHVELDALYHEPGWVAAETEVFLGRVAAFAAGEGWVSDGNYTETREVLWPRAHTIVWLDYSFGLTGWRLLRRSVTRSARREELWNGNRESFRKSFASSESILLWFLRTYHRNRRRIPAALAAPEHAHLAWVWLRSPRATERWLERLAEGEPAATR
jgi:adenylate kinase family enzyme